MDIQKYISSGILENFVLGLVSDEERLDVEKNIKLYPELKTELDAIEQALEAFATSYKTKAPPELKDKIKERLGFNVPSTPRPVKVVEPVASTIITKYLFGALILLGAALLSFWFYDQKQNTEVELEKINSVYAALKSDCATKDEELKRLQNKLQILREAGNLKVQMNGTDKVPDAIASIIYNAKSGKSYLDILHLPIPANDKQYQLWAIVDGKPVDMGVFDVSLDMDTILQEVPFIEAPQAFAVTLEKKGGNPTPTMEEMVVVGNFVAG